MTQTSYRPYRDYDAPAIKQMVNQAFRIHRYAPTRQLLDSALEVYLRQCLLASTYTRVAVRQGQVVGLIMGRVPGEARVPAVLRNTALLCGHMARIGLTGGRHIPKLLQHVKIERAYSRLRRASSVPLTDELTLFAVDESTRGTGVGLQLYRGYLEHLRALGRTDFFLYTDSDCTYQFYENRGMGRAAAEDLPLRFDDGAETLGVYLYTGQVNQ